MFLTKHDDDGKTSLRLGFLWVKRYSWGIKDQIDIYVNKYRRDIDNISFTQMWNNILDKSNDTGRKQQIIIMYLVNHNCNAVSSVTRSIITIRSYHSFPDICPQRQETFEPYCMKNEDVV